MKRDTPQRRNPRSTGACSCPDPVASVLSPYEGSAKEGQCRRPFVFLPKPELRWPALFALLFMLATCLPYLFALFIKQPGWYYSGFLTNPDDHNVYLSYMRQARDGCVFFADQFTTEPQPARVINLLWLALGLFARVTHLSLPIVYHLARLASGWLLLMAVYWLAAQATSSIIARRLALILTATASGFGWLLHVQGGQPHPIDYGPGLVMPEAITLLALLLNPLFAFSMFLMILTFGLAAHAFSTGSVRSAALAGLTALILGNIHSYDLIPVAVIIAVYVLVQVITRRARPTALLLAALIAAIAAPALIYQYWLRTIGDMTIIVKLVGPPAESPPMRWFALGLGLPLIVAIISTVRGAAKASDALRLLIIWFVVGFALVFVPVPFNRKLAEGLHIPICILAALAIEPLLLSAPRRALVAAAALVAICFPSNALYLRRAVSDLISNNQAYIGNLMPPLYLRPDQYGALRSLSGQASRSDVLLANTFLSNYAPSIAGCRVYLGHWSETLDYTKKIKQLSDFFAAGTPDSRREAFCREHGIAYVLSDRSVYDDVFLPPSAQAEGAFDPDRSPWLSKTYEQGDVAVYGVTAR